MKKYWAIALFIPLLFAFYKFDASFKELELKKVLPLVESYETRFDLSGILLDDGHLYVVADKGYDNYIYEIELNSNTWRIKRKILLEMSSKKDLEGIDKCDDVYYLIDEERSEILTYAHGKVDEYNLKWDEFGMNPKSWKGNAGLEGVAVDCVNKKLYLAKEREPRFILQIDIETGTILKQFNIPETESDDFSDLKFENGFLYALERNGNYVAKIDVDKEEVVQKVSYKTTASAPQGKLYGPEKFGMAEALLLTEDEIIIGLDNNGKYMSEHMKNEHGLEGNKPVLLFFERPEGF